MGYESRIYVVEKFDTVRCYDDGKCFAETIAMFNMCKIPALSNVLRYEPKTDCYIYDCGGEARILEDCYGEPLTETSMKTVIDILEEEVAKGEQYWRIFPLLSMLKSIYERFGESERIVVLHYGY